MNERDLFLSALEIEDPSARKTHLQAACADNAELLARVEALLASHEGESRFLQTPVVEQLGDEIAPTIVMGTGSTEEEVVSENQEQTKMADEIPLGYLEPSTRPGSLGRLAHYEILEVVGQGAFGTVLRAFDEKLQRVVAIKVMAPELAATSPTRKRFIREAQASAAIRHENVVSVYSVEEKPIPYLVMEYIPGETLQQRLNRTGPLDVSETLRIGRQIAEGLAAAHATDLIHRDIKPGNVLLEGGQHKVKITDFGLARAADDASMTQSGMIAGTPMYMAPEQALGQMLDQRADLFSLGSVIYQMVSGRPPFRANTTVAVLKRVAEDTPRPIREVIPETPQWLCDIISKLHAKDPKDRFQSAREVADVLADCEAQLKANSKLQDYSRIPQNKRPPAGKSGRWKWVAAAAMLIPVLVLAVLAIPFLYRYATNEGTLIYSGAIDPNLENILIKRDGQVVAKLLTSHGIVHLPAGDYEAEVVCKDGYELARYRRGPFSVLGDAPDALGWEDAVGGTIPLTLTRDWDVGISLKLAKVSADSGWVQLFNGKDFTGWVAQTRTKDQEPHAPWKIVDGVLIARGGNSGSASLRTVKAYENYELKLKFRFPRRAPGDQQYTTQTGLVVRRQEAEFVNLTPEIRLNLGHAWEGRALDFGVYPRTIAKVAVQEPVRYQPSGEWNELAVTCSGGTIDASINGNLTIKLTDCQLSTGYIALDAHGTPIDYRDIVIKELPPSAPPTFTNTLGMEFVLVPKGKSWLGGGNDKLGDKEVEIPADFYLGKYEVTQEEWEKVLGENPSHFSRTGDGKDAVKDIPDVDLKRFPVEQVSWDDCQRFVEKLNQREKETGWVYRLPKETEWEYACRGGPMADRAKSAFDFYFAKSTNTLLPEQANRQHGNGLNRTCVVGNYKPNQLGLCDMHGNVWEWCLESCPTPPVLDPRDVSSRVMRGGGWSLDASDVRAMHRGATPPAFRGNNLGLRLARVPAGEPALDKK